MGVLFKREDFINRIRKLGYEANEHGFKQCIEIELTRMKTYQLSNALGIDRMCLLRWIKKFGIVNPNKPGGNNNPGGFYGSKGSRRDLNKGIMYSKEEMYGTD